MAVAMVSDELDPDGGMEELEDMDGMDGDDWERIRKIRRFRELFGGRFTDKESEAIVEHHDYDINAAVTFALEATHEQMRDVLARRLNWQTVTYVRRSNVLRDLARRNEVGAEVRQFTCTPCDNMWWRNVPKRKPVSRCKFCKRRYDALPPEKEYGLARFVCPCSNVEYRAFGAMDVSLLGPGLPGKSLSICYTCEERMNPPIEILRPTNERRRSRRTHWCTAENCYNWRDPRRRYPQPHLPIVPVCVHPKSTQRHQMKILVLGQDHTSTGSTVKTFLTQDMLPPPYTPYEPSLAPIDSDSGDGGP